jgi:hypothetical protein
MNCERFAYKQITNYCRNVAWHRTGNVPQNERAKFLCLICYKMAVLIFTKSLIIQMFQSVSLSSQQMLRHQQVCTNHMHKKWSYETHTDGIIQNFKYFCNTILTSMFSECTHSSQPPHYSWFLPQQNDKYALNTTGICCNFMYTQHSNPNVWLCTSAFTHK